MSEKRFKLEKDTEWWFVSDNTIKVNEFGYREDLTGEDKYRGLQQDLTEEETVEILNELHEENKLHKERISLLSSLLDLADAIIDTSDNEKAKEVWENKNEQTEKEWERILND